MVGIIMGSESDLPVMKEAANMLQQFAIAYELTIVSAHRTPERMRSYATEARQKGIKVIIAGAGGAAHLPGMVASYTSLPFCKKGTHFIFLSVGKHVHAVIIGKVHKIHKHISIFVYRAKRYPGETWTIKIAVILRRCIIHIITTAVGIAPNMF